MTPAPEAPAPGPRALAVGVDPALAALLAEWLAEGGCSVAQEDGGANGFDLIVADVAFPRQEGRQLLERLARRHPGTPVIALSSAFFPGIDSAGAVARSLGVARVLPKPVTRDALLAAVAGLLGRPE